MNKNTILTILISFAILSLACVCGGGAPQTNSAPVSADTLRKVNFTEGDTIYSYGDSFTDGYNASPRTTNGYIYLLADFLNCYLEQKAVSGTYASQAWAALKTDKLAGKNKQVVFMTGVNDYRATTSSTFQVQTLKYIGYIKSAITLQFLKSWIPATAASVSLSGTWDSTTYSGSGLHSKFLYSTSNNATATYTFTDSTLVIGTFGGTNGSFDVTIDGVWKGRYFFSGFSDGNTTQTLIYRGLTNASHTVVVKKIGTTISELDYFGHLKDASICKPIVIGELPNWNKADYAATVGTNYFPLINNMICAATSDFYGYPVAVAPVNAYLNPETDIDTDNVHPTNAGHVKIFNAFKSVIN